MIKFHKHFRFFLAVTLILGAGMLFLAFFNQHPKEILASLFTSNKTVSLEEHADRMIEKCKKAGSNQRCYDEEIPHLMDFISMKEAFEVTKIIQEKDPTYWFCHELGHNLSEKEYAKDPAKWKDVVTSCPVGMCSNGCVHGAIQRHFIAASLDNTQLQELLPVVESLCERRTNWNPTPLEQASCYHELGHLSHYLTDTNIPKSKELCDTIALKEDGRNYLQTCYEGMFMQLFEPREPEDFALIYNIVPYKEKLGVCEQYTSGVEKGACWKIGWLGKEKEFCNQFTGEIRGACFREAWVIQDEKIETPEGIVEYCNYSDDPTEKRKCYNKLYYSLMAKFEFDEERMKPICMGLPRALQGQCFANTASRMIETDKRLVEKALSMCAFAATLGVERECYGELAHYATFALHAQSDESLSLCNSLPEPWSTSCLSR
ncbi:MAG: hypothetical protein KJI72_01530 [Patescibacteria group bacterium]|nr:hypothetical protein [Patescibacteria group bacterium]